jgi:hypothetical protein
MVHGFRKCFSIVCKFPLIEPAKWQKYFPLFEFILSGRLFNVNTIASQHRAQPNLMTVSIPSGPPVHRGFGYLPTQNRRAKCRETEC